MSKTQENLLAAFAGESQARNMYTYFANVARKEGYHYIAKVFEETAINEMRHAKDEFVLAGKLGDTAANLQEALVKVLISDFYFPEDEFERAIGHFRHYQHELIVFHVLTDLEVQLPLNGMIRFRDLETGEEVVTQAEAIREEFTAAVRQWQQGLERLCRLHEIDYVPIHTNMPLPLALREYFKVRSELF